MNGNGRRLDVWLIYGCTRCGRTWKLTVHTRVTPESLGPLLTRYEENDEELAAAVACDPSLARRAGVRHEPTSPSKRAAGGARTRRRR